MVRALLACRGTRSAFLLAAPGLATAQVVQLSRTWTVATCEATKVFDGNTLECSSCAQARNVTLLRAPNAAMRKVHAVGKRYHAAGLCTPALPCTHRLRDVLKCGERALGVRSGDVASTCLIRAMCLWRCRIPLETLAHADVQRERLSHRLSVYHLCLCVTLRRVSRAHRDFLRRGTSSGTLTLTSTQNTHTHTRRLRLLAAPSNAWLGVFACCYYLYRHSCLPCGTNAVADVTDCRCTNATEVLLERSPSGTLLEHKTCAPCPPRTRVFTTAVGSRRADPYTCQACPDPRMTLLPSGLCECDAGYVLVGKEELGSTVCASAASVSTFVDRNTGQFSEDKAKTVVYFRHQLPSQSSADRHSVVSIDSMSFRHMYAPAATRCVKYSSEGDATACSTLAHLCVLQTYDRLSTVCHRPHCTFRRCTLQRCWGVPL